MSKGISSGPRLQGIQEDTQELQEQAKGMEKKIAELHSRVSDIRQDYIGLLDEVNANRAAIERLEQIVVQNKMDNEPDSM